MDGFIPEAIREGLKLGGEDLKVGFTVCKKSIEAFHSFAVNVNGLRVQHVS